MAKETQLLVQTLPLVSNISLDNELPPELISYREDENNSKEKNMTSWTKSTVSPKRTKAPVKSDGNSLQLLTTRT